MPKKKRRILRSLTWPRRRYRIWCNHCPWCGKPLYCNYLSSGPVLLQSGTVKYCSDYHYFESICFFSMSFDKQKVYILHDDPEGNLPQETLQIIDALKYGVNRVVLHQHMDDILLKDLQEQTVDAAIRSCETIMDRILNL